MGIFGFGNKSTESSGINLDKTAINLNKEKVHSICLSKAPLNGLKAQVVYVFDYSGSMGSRYRSGEVQKALEAIFPIAMEFDDNGSAEVWLFENGFHRLPDLTIDNLGGYINRETKRYSMGGTCYAPVMEDIVKTFKDSKLPTYVVFITDGDNSDKSKTDKIIIEAAKYPIFWQFVGLGNDGFAYLTKLDDMEGRYVDNADFFSVATMKDITYDRLLDEFPGWLEYPEVKNMLR